jgi:cyclopropane fatty-acyl-phospholipid synthase-like methyltransferase
MKNQISKRLQDIVDALPLKEGMRVLEIGCGPGAMARAICARIGNGEVLGVDRSPKAIAQAVSGSEKEVETGRLMFRQTAVEDFELRPGEQPFDLAVAVRVGALDGRHPELEEKVGARIAAALMKEGRLYTDGGDPLKEIPLGKFR